MRRALIGSLLAGLLLGLGPACATTGAPSQTRSALPDVEECPRASGTLLARIRTIAGAPPLRITLRPDPADRPERAAAVLAARVVQAGGDVLERSLDDGLLTFTVRLPVPTPGALAPLLVPGRLSVHPVADERVGELAELIRARLAAEPELLLERWSDGPAALVSTDRDALLAFIATLPSETDLSWHLLEVPGAKETSYRALLLGPAAIEGADIRRCETTLIDASFGLQVRMALTEQGGARFGDLTRAQVKRRVAIVLDGRVLVAPVVLEPITGGELMLSVHASDPVDRALVALLRAGELAGPLTLLDFGLSPQPPAPSADGGTP